MDKQTSLYRVRREDLPKLEEALKQMLSRRIRSTADVDSGPGDQKKADCRSLFKCDMDGVYMRPVRNLCG